MTATSKVDIINMALDHVGQAPIASIDPASSRLETVVLRHYDPVRQALLREYMWNFAKARATLARTSTPAFDFTDGFNLPPDCLRVISITDSTGEYDILDYDIEGRTIMVDGDGQNILRLRYISDVEDVSLFDPCFVQLLALRLALKLSFKLTLKQSIVNGINALIAAEEMKAVSIDGQERPPVVVNRRSSWLNARRGGSFNSDYRYEP